MDNNIPTVIEVLFLALCSTPNPDFWPEHLKDDPMRAHGLLSFYRGLQLGLQLGDACFDKC